jgi:hypothetical protein
MYATINLPGSTHFEAFGPNTRAECEEWLEAKKAEHKDMHGGAWVSTYCPARIVTNREARSWKYQDGRPVLAR